jgi:hypothetical protein
MSPWLPGSGLARAPFLLDFAKSAPRTPEPDGLAGTAAPDRMPLDQRGGALSGRN